MKKVNISMDFMKPVKGFFKKYTALLPSIGIVIVAVLLFFPTLLVGKGVKEKMNKSVADGKQILNLQKEVPSKDDPLQYKTFMDRLEQEAKQIETLVTQTSQRELISYDVFPPKSTSQQLYTDFGKKYRAAIEGMVQGMNALDAPSDLEIQEKTGSHVTRTASVQARKPQDIDPVVDALCLQRAQSISVYAHPSLFAWYNFWQDYQFLGESQALEDCWDSQTAFWIYADIAQTIDKMNAGSSSVSSSPVKRLMGVSFSGPLDGDKPFGDEMMMYRRGGGAAANRDIPNYVVGAGAAGETGTASGQTGSQAGGAMPSNFVASSLTARKSDDAVDVVHFGFSVLVDNRQVMAFMKELCSEKSHAFRTDFKEDGQPQTLAHNQISILQSSVKVVDKQAPEHERYRYGKGAVMRLDLSCEYQFVRKGYDVIKPDPIKVRLGQPIESAGSTDSAPTSPGAGGVPMVW